MQIITSKTFEQARKLIQSAKPPVIFTPNDDELNRKVLEKIPIDILLINQKGRRDSQKQRNSGFNQVLAKIAKKNKIEIGINFDEIIEARAKEKAQILARIRQNIKLCNKNKIRMKFISPSGKFKRDKYDLRALGLVLGMPSWITKSL